MAHGRTFPHITGAAQCSSARSSVLKRDAQAWRSSVSARSSVTLERDSWAWRSSVSARSSVTLERDSWAWRLSVTLPRPRATMTHQRLPKACAWSTRADMFSSISADKLKHHTRAWRLSMALERDAWAWCLSVKLLLSFKANIHWGRATVYGTVSWRT